MTKLRRTPRIHAEGLLWAAGTFAATVGLLFAACVAAGQLTRLDADARRAPVYSGSSSHTSSDTSMFVAFDALADDLQHSVVLLAPAGPESALPPGLASWPEPGQAVLSPALLEEGRAEEIDVRYGPMAGTISPEGLSSPAERLAYVRPRGDVMPADAPWVTGFGMPRSGLMSGVPAMFGSSLNTLPVTIVLLAVGLFVVLPSVSLLVAVGARGSARRQRRDQLLAVLGTLPSRRRWERVKPLVGWYAIGVLAALSLVLTLAALPVTLPATGYVTTSFPAQAHVGGLLMTSVIAYLSAVGLAARQPRRVRDSVRAVALVETLDSRWLLLGPLAVFLTVRLPGFLVPGGGLVWTALYWTGLAASVCLLPLSFAALARLVCTGVRRWAVRRRAGTMLVAAAVLRGDGRMLAQVALVSLVAATLVFQGLLWTRATSEPVRDAVAARVQVGDAVAVVTPREAVPVSQVRAALPPDAAMVRVSATPRGTVVRATCPEFVALRMTCATPDLNALPQALRLALSDVTGSPIRVVELSSAQTLVTPDESVVIFSPNRDLDLPLLKQSVNASLPGFPTVDAVGASWIQGARALEQQGRWVLVFGAVGALLTFFALAVVVGSRQLRHASRIAPLVAVAGRPSSPLLLAGVTVAGPFLVAAVTGVAVSALLVEPLNMQVVGGSVASDATPMVLGAAVVVSLVTWAVVGVSVTRHARRWRPGGGVELAG